MVRKTIGEIKKELSWLKEYSVIHSVLIFGSFLTSDHPRDIDICLVTTNGELGMDVYGEITMRAPKYYDFVCFEELPLYLKIEIINNHIVLFSRNVLELYEYFYKYRKLWKDQKRRNELSKEEELEIIRSLSRRLTKFR